MNRGPAAELSGKLIHTVHPIQNAHGFALLCLAVVMLAVLVDSHDAFTHILQGCFTGTRQSYA